MSDTRHVLQLEANGLFYTDKDPFGFPWTHDSLRARVFATPEEAEKVRDHWLAKKTMLGGHRCITQAIRYGNVLMSELATLAEYGV